MPKLRHGSTDIGKFANWLGRKVVNHNALSELKKTATERDSLPAIYNAKGHGKVHQVGDDEGTIICDIGDGRAMKVTVEELDRAQYEAVKDRLSTLIRA
jgi:hypothetical protein